MFAQLHLVGLLRFYTERRLDSRALEQENWGAKQEGSSGRGESTMWRAFFDPRLTVSSGASRSDKEAQGNLAEAWLCHGQVVRCDLKVLLRQDTHEPRRLIFAPADKVDLIWSGIARELDYYAEPSCIVLMMPRQNLLSLARSHRRQHLRPRFQPRRSTTSQTTNM